MLCCSVFNYKKFLAGMSVEALEEEQEGTVVGLKSPEMKRTGQSQCPPMIVWKSKWPTAKRTVLFPERVHLSL